MPPTYSQVMEYSRTDAGRAAYDRLVACYPDDPALGMTWTQIGAASTALGYPSSWPALAANYYLLQGQNVWPNCRGGMNVGPLPSGAAPNPPGDPAGNAGVPALPFDTSTLFLIGGVLVAILVLKRFAE